jgi:hypothetical protein
MVVFGIHQLWCLVVTSTTVVCLYLVFRALALGRYCCCANSDQKHQLFSLFDCFRRTGCTFILLLHALDELTEGLVLAEQCGEVGWGGSEVGWGVGGGGGLQIDR